MERGGLSVAEFLPHNSAINSRFQSENWPIFENHAIKGPAHLGILRVRGGSSYNQGMPEYNPPEMLTSELAAKYTPPTKPQPPAEQPGDKHLLLLDTFAAYRSLMYYLSNEQVDNLQEAETVDDTKIGLCAAAQLYTGAMEQVERATRGEAYAAAHEEDCESSPYLTQRMLQRAKLVQFVVEEQLKTGKVPPDGLEIIGKARRLSELFMSNKHLPPETREFVAAISLVATQYILCSYMSEDGE